MNNLLLSRMSAAAAAVVKAALDNAANEHRAAPVPPFVDLVRDKKIVEDARDEAVAAARAAATAALDAATAARAAATAAARTYAENALNAAIESFKAYLLTSQIVERTRDDAAAETAAAQLAAAADPDRDIRIGNRAAIERAYTEADTASSEASQDAIRAEDAAIQAEAAAAGGAPGGAGAGAAAAGAAAAAPSAVNTLLERINNQHSGNNTNPKGINSIQSLILSINTSANELVTQATTAITTLDRLTQAVRAGGEPLSEGQLVQINTAVTELINRIKGSLRTVSSKFNSANPATATTPATKAGNAKNVINKLTEKIQALNAVHKGMQGTNAERAAKAAENKLESDKRKASEEKLRTEIGKIKQRFFATDELNSGKITELLNHLIPIINAPGWKNSEIKLFPMNSAAAFILRDADIKSTEKKYKNMYEERGRTLKLKEETKNDDIVNAIKELAANLVPGGGRRNTRKKRSTRKVNKKNMRKTNKKNMRKTRR